VRRLILLFISGVVASQAATPEVFKANARRFYEEVWFGHKADVVDELFAEEYINHDPRDPDAKARAEGRKAPRSTQKELVRQQAASSGRIESQVAEGDLVVTRWIWSMPLASAWERFVAGKDHIEIPVVQTFRFNEAGRIVEVWNQCDDYGIDEQMRVSGLYYFEGFLFGVVLTLVASSLLRRKKPWPSAASQSKTTS
jgi:predicted SnoaL-like aldol condensation-catalyzing enzyme